MADFSDASWDGSPSAWPSTADYCDDCLVNTNTGPREKWTQDKCHLPYRRGGTIYRGAIRAILAVLAGARGGVKVGDRAAIRAKVERLAREAGIDIAK